MRKRVLGGIFGVWSGAALALAPTIASAQAQSRALSPGGDWRIVVMMTAAGILGMFLAAGIGYLYRRERQLDWGFQNAELPDEGAHH